MAVAAYVTFHPEQKNETYHYSEQNDVIRRIPTTTDRTASLLKSMLEICIPIVLS